MWSENIECDTSLHAIIVVFDVAEHLFLVFSPALKKCWIEFDFERYPSFV